MLIVLIMIIKNGLLFIKNNKNGAISRSKRLAFALYGNLLQINENMDEHNKNFKLK